MKSVNRREFLKGSIGAATTFTVLSQSKRLAVCIIFTKELLSGKI